MNNLYKKGYKNKKIEEIEEREEELLQKQEEQKKEEENENLDYKKYIIKTIPEHQFWECSKNEEVCFIRKDEKSYYVLHKNYLREQIKSFLKEN